MIQESVKCSHKTFLFLSLFPYQFPVRPHFNVLDISRHYPVLFRTFWNTCVFIYP